MAKVNIPVIDGTSQQHFSVGTANPASAAGVILLNNSGNLVVKLSDQSATSNVTGAEFLATGNTGLVINSDAAGAGSDWSLSIARPASGMTAAWTLTLPTSAGSAGQVLSTDGSGNTTWVSASSTAQCYTVDTTSVAFGSSSTISAFTLPANAIVVDVQVIIDTPFDGTANLSVGISGNASKYFGAGMSSLQTDATSVFSYAPGIAADASPEAIEIAYSAGGATVGAARVLVTYAVPA